MTVFTIGLDLGTTACKAVALTPEGDLLASASSSYPMQTSHPGWAEQDPRHVWQGALASLRELAGQLPVQEAIGLCLSGAMHSSFPADGNGEPLAPAMTWADQRAAGVAQALRQKTDAHALYLRTGCPLQAFYHPAKLRWWQTEAPQIAGKVIRFCTIKEYVLLNLTGEWVMDFSIASATGLMDIHLLKWDTESLSLAGISSAMLPTLVPPDTLVGRIKPEVASLTGLPASLPVVAGASDGALANLGSGAAAPGQSVITVGTSGAVRRVVSQPHLDPLERTWCYLLAEGRWFVGGAINNGGLALQWVREKFYPDLSGAEGYERLMQDAAKISPGAGGLMFLPYFAGERSPHWNPSVRAVLVGLGLEHQRGHVARAILEGVAFCLADVWKALPLRKEPGEPVHLTGGITKSPVWTQIVADVLGVRMVSVEAADASAVGAAMLGQWALGWVTSLEESAAHITPGPELVPDPHRHEFYAGQHQRFQNYYTLVGTEDTHLA